MKVSLLKKSQIALRLSEVMPKFIGGVFLLIYMFMLTVGETDGDMSRTIIHASAAIGYSCFASTTLVFVLSTSLMKTSFFKILPLKKNDIIDLIVTDNFFIVLIYAAVQIVFTAIVNIKLLPYYLCSDAALFALSTLLVPFYLKDRRMYNNAAALGDDNEKTAKRAVFKGAAIGIGFLLLSVVVISFILVRGLKNCDPAADSLLLAAYAAVSILLARIMLAVCHRTKTYFGR